MSDFGSSQIERKNEENMMSNHQTEQADVSHPSKGWSAQPLWDRPAFCGRKNTLEGCLPHQTWLVIGIWSFFIFFSSQIIPGGMGKKKKTMFSDSPPSRNWLKCGFRHAKPPHCKFTHFRRMSSNSSSDRTTPELETALHDTVVFANFSQAPSSSSSSLGNGATMVTIYFSQPRYGWEQLLPWNPPKDSGSVSRNSSK